MSGKVVVITGAAQGIGAATAKKLSGMGMKVALLDIAKDELEKTTQMLRNEGRHVHSVVCDVAKEDQVYAAIENVKKHFGNIDVLVANAGVANPTALHKLQVDQWLEVVDVNVSGVLHCVAAVLPDMMEKREGHIVFMSSISGRMSVPYCAPYCGSKHFIQGFAAGIRQELAPVGIKVTCILPGVVNTNILKTKPDKEVLESFKKFEVNDERERAKLQPEDVAESVSFCLTQKDRVGVNEIIVETSTNVLLSKFVQNKQKM